jgi:hypothetical protein
MKVVVVVVDLPVVGMPFVVGRGVCCAVFNGVVYVA